MKKKVNPGTISFLLEVGIAKAGLELEKEFDKFPEDPQGVEVDFFDLRNHFESLVFQVRNSVEALLGELPEIDLPDGEMPDIDPIQEVVEEGRYHGRHNGDRAQWYFSKPMRDYPDEFTVVIPECAEVRVTGNNGVRFTSGSMVVKQSDVTGRGLCVVIGSQCKAKKCHIVLSPWSPEEMVYNTVDIIEHLRTMYDKSFAWLPYTGSAYGKQAKFVWPELGISFTVPNMSDDFSPRGPEHEVYFCGTKNKPEVSNGKRASIFGPKASFLEIHYNK